MTTEKIKKLCRRPNSKGSLAQPPKRRLTWKLAVSPSGTVKFPRQLLEAIQCWEGDALEARLVPGADRQAVLLSVMPHGLTQIELDRASQKIARDIKGEKLELFTGKFPI